jgi:multimeric flavodoxin WrbA
MKVLAISSSPRQGGNSDVMCDQFLRGAKQAGHTVKKIRLQEHHIAPCTACYACRKNGVCVQEDDEAKIIADMLEADVIALATPIYFYSMSGQLKVMIDRTLCAHKEIKNKKFYYIITAAANQEEAASSTVQALDGFLRCLPKSSLESVIYGMSNWEKGDIYESPAFLKAYEAGLEIK